MATGTSIVGTWQAYTSWGCGGNAVPAAVFTFNADGSWTYSGGGGRWIQVEGMVTFAFTSPAGLSYSANVTRNACVGIMGYTSPPPNAGSGCFYMIRSGSPGGSAAAGASLTADAADARTATSDAGAAGVDPVLGAPVSKKK